jgi:hypothetical protein
VSIVGRVGGVQHLQRGWCGVARLGGAQLDASVLAA